MSIERGKSLRIQKHTDDFERRLRTMQNDIVKLKSIIRNINNPANAPVSVAATPSPEPQEEHSKLIGLEEGDDHPQYLLHTDNIVKTGWEINLDETDVTIAMNDGTRTFTITPIAAMTYFILGVEYSLSAAKTVVIDDTEGLWYIYFVGSTLTASQSRWEIADGDKAMICILYWDATNNATIIIGWQFHSHFMAAGTHDYAHHTFGTRYASGLAVTDAGGDQLNVAAGVIFDEDIEIDITDGAGSDLFEQVLSPAELPILYRDGAAGNWRKIAATTTPVHLVANVLQLNELNGAWALANVTNNSYIAYWILATDDISEPIISIPGQVEGTNIVGVREANPLSSMDFSGLPVAEYKVIARLIVRGLVGGIFYAISAIDDFRAVSSEPGTTQPNIHASSHFANGVDELLLDEDNMVSDLATKGSSQQSIKAYADTKVTSVEAIAAVEGEDPLDMIGDIKLLDGKKLILGTDSDAEIYHDGDHLFIDNSNGRIDITAETDVKLIIADEFKIFDADDGNEDLFNLNTTARTFRVGAADGNDNIATSFYGDVASAKRVTINAGGDNRPLDLISTDDRCTLQMADNDTTFNITVEDDTVRFDAAVGGDAFRINLATDVINFVGQMQNRTDNKGYYTGAEDDLWVGHDGASSFILSTTGALILQNSDGASTIALRLGGSVKIQDSDDGNVQLFGLDTTARTLAIGLAADPIAFTLEGDLRLNDNVGFYNNAPQAQSAAYVLANVIADRAYDANATTVEELADVFGTLIADLQTYGLIG